MLKLFLSATEVEQEFDLTQMPELFGPYTKTEFLDWIDEGLPEDKSQGLLYLGGVIAKKCAEIDDTLGHYKQKFVPDQQLRDSPWFIDGMYEKCVNVDFVLK